MHHPPRTLCHGGRRRTCPLRMFAQAGVCPGAASTGPAGAAAGRRDTAGTQQRCRPERARGGGEADRARCSAAPGRRERFHLPPGDRERLSCPPGVAGRLPSAAAAAGPRHTGCPAGDARPAMAERGFRAPPTVPGPRPRPRSPASLPSSRRLRAPPAAAVGDACAAVAVPGGEQSPSHAALTVRALRARAGSGWPARLDGAFRCSEG